MGSDADDVADTLRTENELLRQRMAQRDVAAEEYRRQSRDHMVAVELLIPVAVENPVV